MRAELFFVLEFLFFMVDLHIDGMAKRKNAHNKSVLIKFRMFVSFSYYTIFIFIFPHFYSLNAVVQAKFFGRMFCILGWRTSLRNGFERFDSVPNISSRNKLAMNFDSQPKDSLQLNKKQQKRKIVQ